MTSRIFKALSWISLISSSVWFSIWYMMGLVVFLFFVSGFLGGRGLFLVCFFVVVVSPGLFFFLK